MALYINTLTGICRPFVHGYHSGIFGAVLNAAHSLWWVQARRADWENEPEKLLFPCQLALSSYLLDNPLGKTATSSLLNIVKLDDINNSYSRRRQAYTMIRRAWSGEFSENSNDVFDRFFLTICKILNYIKESFYFFMTCVDAAKALQFNDQAKVEALSNLINNTVRVGYLLLCPKQPLCLKLKLRYNIDLIKSCFHVDNDTALQYIENIYRELLAIQQHPVMRGAYAVINAKQTRANYVKKASSALGVLTDHVMNFFTGSDKEKKQKKPSGIIIED